MGTFRMKDGRDTLAYLFPLRSRGVERKSLSWPWQHVRILSENVSVSVTHQRMVQVCVLRSSLLSSASSQVFLLSLQWSPFLRIRTQISSLAISTVESSIIRISVFYFLFLYLSLWIPVPNFQMIYVRTVHCQQKLSISKVKLSGLSHRGLSSHLCQGLCRAFRLSE